MTKWFTCIWFDRVITLRIRGRALQMAGVGLLSCAAAAGVVAQERQSATREGSVLIAIRDASSSNATTSTTTPPASGSWTNGAALEPTSQIADRTPDLAESTQTAQGWKANHWQANGAPDATPPADAAATSAAGQPADESTPFGAALADVVRAQQKKSPPNQQLLERAGGPAAAASARELVPYQPARFNRVQPGSTTLEQIKLAWREPASSETTEEGVVLVYDIEPFAAVEVLV
jgi:hypothetical protein